jgi:alpha/beta superfamily hydrolase
MRWHWLSLRGTGPSLLLLVLVLLPACGTMQATTQAGPPSPTVTPAPPSQPVSFSTQDSVTLNGILYGQGTHAIILSNEGDNNTLAWEPIALKLASRGYLVLVYSYRPMGTTIDGQAAHALLDLRATIVFLRNRNVAGITLIGSSLGGIVSIKEAALEKLDALVAISALVDYQEVHTSDAELQRITCPKLIVTSDQNDPFTGDMLHLYEVTPDPKEERVYPGRKHGLALFQGDSGHDLQATLLQFLQHYVPVN